MTPTPATDGPRKIDGDHCGDADKMVHLPPSRRRVLAVYARRGRLGVVTTLRDVAAELDCCASTVHHHAEALAEAGLLDQAGRRYVISEKGRRIEQHIEQPIE